ncbi:apolipoprotein N-acyltransferase [bacterium]|nr:apolipoprotein N-acyltransferase [bacterium]
MAAGLAPLGFWWLAMPALVLVMRLGLDGSAGRAAWIGWLAGVGYFGAGLNWIVEPFMVDAAHDGWMAPFALFFMATGLALFWCLGFGLGARLAVRRGAGLVAGLTATEFLRGYILTGFPWALPSHVWIGTPVAQVDALVGPFGLTLLTLAAAALAAPLRWRGIGLGLALPAAGWAYGAWVLAQPDPAPRGLTLRLVQPNAPQDAKWDPDHAQFFFDRLMTATAAPPAPGGKVDLVIWPETALPYLIEDNPDLPAMISGAAHGVPVALGLQRIARHGADVLGFNTLDVFGSGGALLASYDKHHLVPFGEYVPLGDLAYDWLGIRAFAAQVGNAYTPGPGPVLLDLGPALGKVLPLICYEAVFPQDLRVRGRADWILQVTNDAWFGTLSGPFQHAAQARLRAIEQGLPLARVANTGVTEMIDARGRITAALPFDTDGFLDVALPGALPAPPYARFGEVPALLLLAALGLWAIRRQSSPSA